MRTGIARTTIVIIVVILIVAAGIAGAYLYLQPGASKPAQQINIGFVWELSGPLADAGAQALAGAQQAVKDINSQGGIMSLGGAQLVLRIADAGSTADTAVSAMQSLLTQYNITAFTGAYDSAKTLAMAKVAEQHQIPLVTLSLADSITAQGYTYVFDTSPPSSVVARTLWDYANYTAHILGIPFNNIAIVADTSPTAVSLVNAIRAFANQTDRTIVYQETIQSGLTDATAIALKIKAAQPTVYFQFVSATSDNLLIINSLAQLGVHIPIGPLGSGDFLVRPAVGQNLGSKANGLTTFSFVWATSKTGTLADTLAKKLNETYTPALTLAAYGQIWLIKEALEKSGSAHPSAVRNALASLNLTSGPATQIFPTSGGSVAFTSNGRIQGITPLMVQWQNGIPYTVYPSQFATRKPLS